MAKGAGMALGATGKRLRWWALLWSGPAIGDETPVAVCARGRDGSAARKVDAGMAWKDGLAPSRLDESSSAAAAARVDGRGGPPGVKARPGFGVAVRVVFCFGVVWFGTAVEDCDAEAEDCDDGSPSSRPPPSLGSDRFEFVPDGRDAVMILGS